MVKRVINFYYKLKIIIMLIYIANSIKPISIIFSYWIASSI